MAARAPFLAVLIASVLALVPLAPTAAVRAVPAVDAAILPGGESLSGMVGDVDADGERELVRLVPWERNPAQQAVEVIGMSGGQPRPHGQERVRRATSPEDAFRGRRADDQDMLPMGVQEPTLLIDWQAQGESRVLAASIGTSDLPRPCCLTLWWVELDGGRTSLRFIQNTGLSAAFLITADLDADGTDELALAETPNPALPDSVNVVVLRWNGSEFDASSRLLAPALMTGPLISLGNSDGLPGEEIGFVAAPGAALGQWLHRIRMEGEALVAESAQLRRPVQIVPLPGPDGGRLVLVRAADLALIDWPAGADAMSVEQTSFRGGEPLGVLGSGDGVRLLLQRGGAVDVLDASLRSRMSISSGVPATWFAGSAWKPYAGDLPGGDRAGRPALVFGGRLLVADDRRAIETRDVAALPGRVPLGLFGPGRGWMAVADAPVLPTAAPGAMVVVAGTRAGSVAVVSAADVLRPEEDGGELLPSLVGGVADDRGSRATLLTAGQILADVSAPEGSRVQAIGPGASIREASVGPAGSAQLELAADVDGGGPTAFAVRLLVVTPAGHGYGARWDVRVIREPPPLTAEAPFAPLSFQVPLSGSTDPRVAVTVNGRRVEVTADGSFSAQVTAGPLPTSVELRAVDPVGNATDLSVSVVGLLDYRRLPWIPLVVAFTLVVAAMYFLRAPRPAGLQRRSIDEGTLEEID